MSTPIPRICWPYAIVASVNDTLVVTCASIGGGSPISATIAADSSGTTYPTPEALGTAVASALQAALGGGFTVAVSISSSGFASLVINAPGGSGAFTIKWTTAAGLGLLLGFAGAASGTDQILSYVTISSVDKSTANAENQVRNFWYPGLPVRTDPRERSTYPRSVVETASAVVAVDLSSALHRRTISFEHLAPAKTLISQEGSNANQALERLFVAPSGGYARFRWYDDATQLETYFTYALRETTAQQFRATRMYDTLELYKLSLEMTATT